MRVGPNGDETLVRGLLDTGAAINVIVDTYCKKNNLPFIASNTVLRGWTANSAPTELIGTLADYLWIGGRKIRTSFQVVKAENSSHDMILGLPFICDSRAVISYNVPEGTPPIAQLIMGNAKLHVPVIPDKRSADQGNATEGGSPKGALLRKTAGLVAITGWQNRLSRPHAVHWQN